MAYPLVGAQPLSEPMVEIIVNLTLRDKFQRNVNRKSYTFIQENTFENVVCEMAAIFSRPQYVKLDRSRSLSGVPDFWDRTKILRCGDLSYLHVPDYMSFLLFCLIFVYSSQYSFLFWIMYLL